MQKKSWRTAVSWQSCWNIKSSSIKYFRDGLINHLFCKKRNAHFFQLRTRILVLILLEGIAFNFKIWGYNLDTKQSVRTWKSQEGSLSRDQASLKKVSLYLRKIRCFEKKYLTKPYTQKKSYLFIVNESVSPRSAKEFDNAIMNFIADSTIHGMSPCSSGYDHFRQWKARWNRGSLRLHDWNPLFWSLSLSKIREKLYCVVTITQFGSKKYF